MSCGIIVALPEELQTLTHRKLERGEWMAVGDDILLVFAGAGPANAEAAAKTLVENGADRLISWGCAAALNPQLRPGNLLIAEQLLFEQQFLETDKRWSHKLRSRLSEKLAVSGGNLVTEHHIVAGSADKQAIHRETGANGLDMESGAIAKVANEAGLPCLVLRAIADPAEMSLPQAVVVALDEQGQVRLGKLLLHLLTHPWQLPDLIRLGWHFRAAQKTLKIIARQLNEIIIY